MLSVLQSVKIIDSSFATLVVMRLMTSVAMGYRPLVISVMTTVNYLHFGYKD